MLDWALNTFLNTIKKFFSWRFQNKVNDFLSLFSVINFPCQQLPEAKAYLEPSQTFYNGAFSRNIFFSKIHKKKPVLESHINKVTGLYTAILLKERTPTQVFSGEFSEMPETFFTERLQVTTSVLQKKDFINKIVKSPLIEGKKIETACKKKSNHTDKTKT